MKISDIIAFIELFCLLFHSSSSSYLRLSCFQVKINLIIFTVIVNSTYVIYFMQRRLAFKTPLNHWLVTQISRKILLNIFISRSIFIHIILLQKRYDIMFHSCWIFKLCIYIVIYLLSIGQSCWLQNLRLGRLGIWKCWWKITVLLLSSKFLCTNLRNVLERVYCHTLAQRSPNFLVLRVPSGPGNKFLVTPPTIFI